MKRCGLKTDPMTSKCDYRTGDNKCLKNHCAYQIIDSPPMKKCNANAYDFNMSCDYKVDGNCVYHASCCYQIEPKLTLEERAKQDCLTCDHKIVCKYKEKFLTMKENICPCLCVCQWYKEEN